MPLIIADMIIINKFLNKQFLLPMHSFTQEDLLQIFVQGNFHGKNTGY